MVTEIFIFKTGVHTNADVQQAASVFRSVAAIKRWSFDLDDCDRILRIEATAGLRPEAVEQLLLRVGIACEPLEYEL